MKINYLILAHKNLGQLKRLIRRLSNENPAEFSIFVHLDKKWDLTESDIKSISFISPNVTILTERISCKLDDWSLIEAECRLMEAAYKKDSGEAYYVMLSGQDYPIRSNRDFVEYCIHNYPKPLIDVTPWDPNNWVHLKFMNSPLYRVLFNIKFNNKIFDLSFRALRRGVDSLIPKRFKMKRQFDKIGVLPYGGSQWWVLPNQVIKEILEEYHCNDKLVKIYKKTLTPDETFFQTMTMRTSLSSLVDVNPPEQVEQDCPTFAYFNPQGKNFTGHPYIINCDAWQTIKKTKPAKFYFARKFDTSIDSEVLNLIDKEVHAQPSL